MSRFPLTALALAATLTLAACESSDEKAENFYQTGMELLATGDVDRAIVSFRNVFRFDGEHYEARKELADALYSLGDRTKAFSQYLRLAEQYPDDVLVRQKLATMAIQVQAWDQAERHGRRALELAPDADISPAIRVSLDYRKAAVEEDDPKLDALADDAASLLEADPTDILSRRIVLAHAVARERPGDVLELVDPAIEQFPDEMGYYALKLRALSALQDLEGVETQLQAMYQAFPENDEVQRSLIQFYLQQQDFEGAEAFLRQLANAKPDAPQGFVPVIQLIERAQGRDAAKAELQSLIAANADQPASQTFFKALLAGYTFEDGNPDQAIADLQALLDGAEPGTQTNRIKNTLANMLLRTGNQVGTRALVEEVLEEDASNVEALKMRARLLIDGDAPDEAISDLRRALDQSPRDLDTLVLLAAAHERNGNSALQGERLAIAVEVSNAGSRESLLYAEYLVNNDQIGAARSVLDDARNTSPRNVDVLTQAARLALAENATGVVRGIIADLEQIEEDPRAAEVAVTLQSALLLQQNRADEGLQLLQSQAGDGGQNTGAVYAVIQTQLRSGDIQGARSYLDELLEKSPEDRNLQLINAALHVAEGKPERSEEILRDVIDKDPTQSTAVGQLYVQLRREGRVEDARAVLNQGLSAAPGTIRLMQYQAGELETLGKIEDAIAIYETIYEQNSANVAVANNLASLISTFRDTEASLARAAAVARRLRGTDVPAFQDTYGWIAYRQGNYKEALEYLGPAAQELPNNPLVNYHLGMTYVALERPEEGRPYLERAIELAGPDTTLPQMVQARETLNGLAAQ